MFIKGYVIYEKNEKTNQFFIFYTFEAPINKYKTKPYKKIYFYIFFFIKENSIFAFINIFIPLDNKNALNNPWFYTTIY